MTPTVVIYYLLPFCLFHFSLSSDSAAVIENHSDSPYLIFSRAAYKNTELRLNLSCVNSPTDYDVQVVLRSSPCYGKFEKSKNKLEHYLSSPEKNDIVFYKSDKIACQCGENEVKNCVLERETFRQKRHSGNQNADLGPQPENFLSLPQDANYLVLIQLMQDTAFSEQKNSITVSIEWNGPYGFLGPEEFPFLPFYAFLALFYIILAVFWFGALYQCNDGEKLKLWIGMIIIFALLESVILYAVYQTANSKNRFEFGAQKAAFFINDMKATAIRMLAVVIICSCIKRPWVYASIFGSFYLAARFVFTANSGTKYFVQYLEFGNNSTIENIFLAFFALIDLGILSWNFVSFVNLFRCENEEPDWTRIYFSGMLSTVPMSVFIFIVYSASSFFGFFNPNFCNSNWKFMWLQTAFWQLLFLEVLLIIMIIWRPENKDGNYRFMLLPQFADEDEEEMKVLDGDSIEPENEDINEVKEAELEEEQKSKDALEDI